MRAYGEFFAGYGQDAAITLSKTFKEVGNYGDIVLVKDIRSIPVRLVPLSARRISPICRMTASLACPSWRGWWKCSPGACRPRRT